MRTIQEGRGATGRVAVAGERLRIARVTRSWPARTGGSKRPSRCVRSWPDSDRGRRLHQLAAGGLFDREQESAADFVERPALGLHREDFESHGAQAPSALGFAAGEMAARLDELALHDAAAAFEAR